MSIKKNISEFLRRYKASHNLTVSEMSDELGIAKSIIMDYRYGPVTSYKTRPELIAAMFMVCTFNAMNIISKKEDGVAFVNEILPMTPSQYILQKVVVGFLFESLSSIVSACICFQMSGLQFETILYWC